QAERLHRSQRVVAEVLPGEPHPVHEHAPAGEDAVRLRLPADHARPLACRLREVADQGRGSAARAQGERHTAAWSAVNPSLIYAVGRVNQGIRREMRAHLAGFSLSVQEYTTLSVLAVRPGLSNAQLARRALVTPQSMIEILSKLESRRLVRRTVDPANARVLRAELTRAGTALL